MSEVLTKLSVIVCTRNRGASLRKTLDSLLTASNLAQQDWELVVVDNGSTDSTSSVLAEYATKFPSHLRTKGEPKKGKSNALNTGVCAARGEILAFTDDDCLCDVRYLEGIREVFSNPDVDAVQGRILVEVEGQRPAWLSQEMLASMGLIDLCQTVHELAPSEVYLHGGNSIVRRSVFAKAGGFRLDLGPGSVAGREGDTEFSRRVAAAGCRIFFVPQILVRHQLQATCMRRRYYFARFYHRGISRAHYFPIARYNPSWDPSVPAWRYKMYYIKEMLFAGVRAFCLNLWGRSADAMDLVLKLVEETGFYWEFARLRRLGITGFPVPAILDQDGQPVRSEAGPVSLVGAVAG